MRLIGILLCLSDRTRVHFVHNPLFDEVDLLGHDIDVGALRRIGGEVSKSSMEIALYEQIFALWKVVQPRCDVVRKLESS